MARDSGGSKALRLRDWEHRLAADLGPQWHVQCFDSLPSTMDAARALAKELSPGDSGIVLTRAQSEGRGRQGRRWDSAEGGFFATYVFVTDKEPQRLSGFSLAAGLAARTTLARFGAELWLKWPNDLLSAQGAKLGGILIEIVSTPGAPTALLCGIGLNLSAAPHLEAATCSLAQLCGRTLTPPELAAPLGAELHSAWSTVLERGFQAFREQWMRAALFVGERLSVDCGSEVVSGTFAEVDSEGRLILDGPSGRRAVVSGHVLLDSKG